MQALPFIGQYEIISKKYEKDIASGGLEAFSALNKKEKELKKYFDFVSQPFEMSMITDYFVGFEKRENRLCYDFKESNEGEKYFTHHFVAFFGINQREDIRPLTTMHVWGNYDKLPYTYFWYDYPATLNDFIDNVVKTNHNMKQLKKEVKDKLYEIPLIFTELALKQCTTT